MAEQKIIRKSEILKMQDEGMKREEIAEHYQVTDAEMKKYFQFLKVSTKAKRKKKESPYLLVNDVDEGFSTKVPEQEERILEKETQEVTH